MPRASPIITAFNAGEFSPLIEGRPDYAKYAAGCKVLENFIPLVQGPAVKRGGTRFVAEVKDSTQRTWLMRFEYNTQQAYALELGHQYVRFYTNHGQVLSGMSPYEIISPYSSSDLTDSNGLFNLCSVESNDVVYITHRQKTFAPYKLTRLGATSWTLTKLSQTGGPFKTLNSTATTVYADAKTGSVTLHASASIFQSGHVGSLFYLEQKSLLDIKLWEPGVSITTGDLRYSDGKNYKALNTATTGTGKPDHTEGALYDGDTGVQWQYQDAGFGIVRITAYTSGTQVAGDVILQLPDDAVTVGNASARWAYGAWSDFEGWPTQAAFYKERLVFSRGNQVWCSVAGDYENFSAKDDSGLVVTDMAVSLTLKTANEIQWLQSGKLLACGTSGGTYAVGPQTDSSPFGPDNVQAPRITDIGSRATLPLTIGEVVLFIQRSGKKLRDIEFDFYSNSYHSMDQSMLAEHIPALNIDQMVYQQEPHSVIWMRRGDGALVAMTYSREQYPDAPHGGWHRHPLGGNGLLESLISIPAPAQDRDEVWLLVNRTINGVTKRYVEYIEWQHRKNDDPEDAFYVDCGLTLNNTINATLTPGAGATVQHQAGVSFTAGSSVFSSGDVGREIHLRYSIKDDSEGKEIVNWHTGKAEITAYTSGTDVVCTINSAFPSTDLIAANDWRMTVMTVTGLGHLEGELVDVLGDGATHPQRTVVSGSISLQRRASKVHVGKACPSRLQTLRLNQGAADGTSQGKIARISAAVIRLLDTLGLQYGKSFIEMDTLDFRYGGDLMDQPSPLFSGDKTIDWPGDNDTDPWLCLQQSDPLPCTVVAIMPQVVVNDRS